MRNSPKTPYEIRLELLQLAFEVLMSQHKARAADDGNNSVVTNVAPKSAPTTEEVIAEAEKMNGFISKAN